MEQLKKQFDSVLTALDQAREKLTQGGFLAQEDRSALQASLDALIQEQDRIRALLADEGGSVESLEEARQLLDLREARQELRRLAEAFQQLRAQEEPFRSELEDRQQKLAACTDAQLRELDRSGGLQPYRDFLDCVRRERPAYEDIAPLIAVFGTALPLGIMGGKFTLPEDGGSGQGSKKTQEAALETPEPEQAPISSPPKAAPVTPELKETPAPKDSKTPKDSGSAPAKEEAVRTEAPAGKAPEEPAEEPGKEPDEDFWEEPEENVILPPSTDPAVLGNLEIQESRKQPKGVKALTSQITSSPVYIQIIFALANSQWVLAPDAPIFKTAGPNFDGAAQEKCLTALVKEGYLSRITLDSQPGRVLYCATEAGRPIFRKVLEKLSRKAKRSELLSLVSPVETAADFRRCLAGRGLFSQTFEIPGLLGFFSEIQGASMITLIRGTRDGDPVEAVLLPSLLYTKDDPQDAQRKLQDHLRETLENAAPGCKVFLAPYDPADAQGWKDSLAPCLTENVELFFGEMDQDLYRAEDGRELSVAAYLEELRQGDGGDGGSPAGDGRDGETAPDPSPEDHPSDGDAGEAPADVSGEASDGAAGNAPEEAAEEPSGDAAGNAPADTGEETSAGTAGDAPAGESGASDDPDDSDNSDGAHRHTPGAAVREILQEPTCAAEGLYEEVICCAVCGEELSRQRGPLPKAEHTPGKSVRKILRPSTCTEKGAYEEVLLCRDCGGEISRDTGSLPLAEHTPGQPVQENVKEPTTKEAGSYEEVISCQVCGAELSRKVCTVPALELTEENQLAEMRRNMYRLFADKKFPSALTMARALGRRKEPLYKEYLQYAYAMDDPAHPKRCCYSELQTVFPGGFGQSLAEDALGIAAYLRLFFSSDAASEAYYLTEVMGTLNQNRAFQQIPELKNVFYDLTRCYERTRTLMTPETLSQLVDTKRTSSLRDQYRKEAGRFLAGTPEESQQMNKRVNGTFRELFGFKSPLRSAVEWVRDGMESKTDEIRELLGDFLKEDEELTGICEDKHLNWDNLERFVQAAWESTKDRVAKNRNENFRDPARSTAVNRLAELTELAMSWVTLGSGGDDVSAETRSFLDTQRRAIAQKMGEAASLCANQAKEGRPEEQAALSVLAATLEALAGFLQEGRDVNDQKHFYLEFLRDNRVEVDENGIPCLEEDFQEIAPLNLCKRILKHSEAELPSWSEVIKRIFEEADEGCDFGHAELIRNYLLAFEEGFVWPETYSFEQSIKAALQRMDEEGRKFQAQLDLAENYGWIDDTSRFDRILADMEKRREHYLSTQNFGFYFRTTEACKEALKREAEHHKGGYMDELARLKAEKGAWPIFNEVQRLISEQMYTVAQDYMDQAQAGQQEAPQSTYLAQTNDVFSRYLKQYNALLSDAREASERRITEIYTRRSRDRDRGIARTGERMMSQWPRSMSPGLPAMLKELFEAMGLPVDRVTRAEHDQHYMVKFLPKGREVNYPHPIGAYGTVMQRNGLHVFLTFGKRNDTAMNAELQRIMSLPLGERDPAIVLADSAITLSERRSLAHKLKSQSKASPYILLDRVLLFFLAEFRQEERWDVLLRCTLPFHAYNPYTESSTVELCPEMFIGRQQELNSIVDSGGANIVYGGRQLGKTALLQRARNLRNIREDGQWAFYLDIRNRSVADTARLIYEMLLDDGFLSEPGGVEVENISWDQLTRKIIQRMTGGAPQVKSVLLLLDEADAFLQGCGETACAYEPIVSLKRIQSRTNRFKFVLAGLHNVMRFSKKAAQNDDSPIPHLAPITLRPLPFHEARELIELPLSYLGFKVRPENDYLIVQILSSTNYFPGLIQYYCSSLVNTANQNFLGDANERPPYWLEEAQILTLLKDKKFQENIKNKYEITLGVDEKEKGYYKTLAYSLARCYFSHPENLASGYTADDIHAVCRDLDIHSITDLDREQVVELLDELIDLNVLRDRRDGGEKRYIFNRASFRHMLGSEQEVDDELEKIMEKEASYV